jgi:hypothetical protein
MNPRTRFLSVLFILLFVLSPGLGFAKGTGKIAGKVLSGSGQGLLGAVITVFRHDHEGGTISFTRTDRNGGYSLANIASGSYNIQVSRDGYQAVTNAEVRIESGRTTTMNVVLQELLELITGPPDPRNWDLKAVMRSTSDRRLIFRDLPGTTEPSLDADAPFSRASTVAVTSNSGQGSENHALFPSNGQSGIATNFAFVEPVSYRGRMIFSGQISTGYDSSWQIRNTYNYRPDPGRDFKLSVGYGRLSFGGPTVGNMGRPSQFFAQDFNSRENGIQTLGLGFEARNKVFDALTFEYGFDLSRVYYGPAKNFISPYFQVVVTPLNNWALKTAVSSRRWSDNYSLTLPDGDVLNLIEPTYVAGLNNEVRFSQFKHSEVALARTLPQNATIEVAVYEDHMQGPGLPFMVTASVGSATSSYLVQPREDQTAQHGMRLAFNRKFLDFLNGSIAYVYGTGSSLTPTEQDQSGEAIATNMLNYVQRQYYHAVTGQITAVLPRTRTGITTVVRWYPGYSLTPIDLFADRTDALSKGFNFSIRQPIPLPEFMGTPGRWEALVDVRNLFDQGRLMVPATDGQVLLTRNPRLLRFGINLNLY